MIERAAALSGQSVASFVIGHAREAADKVLEGHHRIRLNAEQSKRFVDALDAPSRRVQKVVKEAFIRYRRSVSEG